MTAINLTVVSAGRNDGYGGRLAERVALHCSSLAAFSHGLGEQVQHVFVDWNPVPEAPFSDLAPEAPPNVDRRIVVCSGRGVDALVDARAVPFVETAAKNAGLAAVDTEWVALTNSDVALTFELGVAVGSTLRSLGGTNLFLRADRLDITYGPDEALPTQIDVRDALGRARALHRRHGLDACHSASVDVRGLPDDEIAMLASQARPADLRIGPAFLLVDSRGPMRGLHTNASGDFLVARKSTFLMAGGLDEQRTESTHFDSLLVAALVGRAHARQVCLQFPAFVVHVDHDRTPGYGTGSIPFARVAQAFDRLVDGHRE